MSYGRWFVICLAVVAALAAIAWFMPPHLIRN
jgi:hypothetical protein